jgi:hypothetical protein
MNPLKKVAGYNLLAVLVYSTVIHFAINGDSLSVLLFSAVAVGIQVVICIVISLGFFASQNREWGRAWLLGAGIVLLIGFSTCLGNAALSDATTSHHTSSSHTHKPSSPPPSAA